VDHGTALDLAGKGIADCGSFEVAISMATQMASLQVESID
jgi:4-hydroxythreonine-4-phosphate dehydrogenase